jgi:two-component system NtrC family response regulator
MDNILVVEDHLELYPWMETSVADDGRTVYTATTREKALQLISQYDFDVVVTDLALENDYLQDGIDVLNAAKEKDPYTEIIVVTSKGTWKWGVKAMALGAFDYLQKDAMGVDVAVMLRAKVKQALKLRKAQLKSNMVSQGGND